MSIVPQKEVFIHIPVGLFNILLLYISIPIGFTFAAGFLAYEITQGGKPHIDIQSWLWGLGIGGVIWGIVKMF